MKESSVIGLKTVALLAAITALIGVYMIRNSGGEPAESSGQSESAASADGAVSRAELGNSDYLFSQDRLHTFEITLPDENLAILDADPTAEEYVEGNLSFEGEDLGPVGVRYKGNIGAFAGCTEQNDGLVSGGAKTCTKLSVKVKVNWGEQSGREIYGQRKLQFHSHNPDTSALRERLAYWLFDEMGVPAPRSTHARLVVNGQYVGLFGLTEQIDGRLTRDRFDDGKGNLYKEVWPFSSRGLTQDAAELIAGLQTNEDAPDVSMMQAFADELRAADDDLPGPTRRDVLEKWMDVDHLISYAVIDRAIGHDDGPMHWRCTDDGCGTQNFYWYSEPETGKIHLIPWDMDLAFENLVNENPYTGVADGWGEITNDCEPFAYGALERVQRSAACDPLWGALSSVFADEHAAKVDELLAGPFAAETVDARIDAWATQIEPHIAEAAELHLDAPSVEEWRAAVEELRASLDVSRANPTGR